MKNKYKLYCGIIFLLILFSFIFRNLEITKYSSNNRFAELNNYNVSEEKKQYLSNSEGKNNNYINDDFTVNDDFKSHLPIILIDLNENDIPDEYEYNEDTNSFELKDKADPYSIANMKIINNKDRENNIYDTEEISSKIKIRYRGNTSITFAKKQYGIKLLDEDENECEKSILGMEADEDWILNISMSDPSLIRNYLALNIGGQVMEMTPEVRYCELIIKSGDSYEYKGLYLMMESVKKGQGRVDISSYNTGDNYTSYLLRRDRYKDSEMILKTEAALNEECYGWMEVKYPSEKNINDDLYDYIYNDINNIEQIIYSDDDKIFNTYDRFIDEDSFVDYFLINEFFMNYDAGNNSTYLYMNAGDKLKIGPFWDFDLAVDNYSNEPANLKNIAFSSQAWFERLVNSKQFTKKLVKRYSELRKDIISEENIEGIIDDTVEYLGDAVERDYLRWQSEYENLNIKSFYDENGILVHRNFISFEDEIHRVKDDLRIHGLYMKYRLADLDNSNTAVYENKRYTGLAISFLVLFFCSVVIARRQYN